MIDITDTHAFFYTEWPSNWANAAFDYTSRYGNRETNRFFTTEHAFMYEKAMFFGDTATAKKILTVIHPREAKALGRKVKNFDTAKWDKERYAVMVAVNLEKFRQNPELFEKLADPKFDGRTFVEASPVDGIWGIGLPMGAPGIDDERNWRGTNLLGKALTEVRKVLCGK